MSELFRASCDLNALQARAKLYQSIRHFFAERQVLEVETPILSHAAVTDVHLASIAAIRHMAGQPQQHYLQTSPEYAMKRLLACGSGAIYQICKVFRDHEHGRKHNSEFSMLEWYRPDYALNDLMQETADLLNVCLAERFGELHPQIVRYKDAFAARLEINPLQASWQQLKDCARRVGLNVDLGQDRLAYMDLLFSHMVEPSLGYDSPIFLTDFPPEMAALACQHHDDDGELVASRFEVYIEGLELANAYHELGDAAQLAARFAADNAERQLRGLPCMPIDEHLLAAIEHLPPCSGIALGLDRLLMLKQNTLHIDRVISFPAQRA